MQGAELHETAQPKGGLLGFKPTPQLLSQGFSCVNTVVFIGNTQISLDNANLVSKWEACGHLETRERLLKKASLLSVCLNLSSPTVQLL